MNFQRYSFGAQTRRSIIIVYNEHVWCNLYLVRALQCCLRHISNNRVHMYTRNILFKIFLVPHYQLSIKLYFNFITTIKMQ